MSCVMLKMVDVEALEDGQKPKREQWHYGVVENNTELSRLWGRMTG